MSGASAVAAAGEAARTVQQFVGAATATAGAVGKGVAAIRNNIKSAHTSARNANQDQRVRSAAKLAAKRGNTAVRSINHMEPHDLVIPQTLAFSKESIFAPLLQTVTFSTSTRTLQNDPNGDNCRSCWTTLNHALPFGSNVPDAEGDAQTRFTRWVGFLKSVYIAGMVTHARAKVTFRPSVHADTDTAGTYSNQRAFRHYEKLHLNDSIALEGTQKQGTNVWRASAVTNADRHEANISWDQWTGEGPSGIHGKNGMKHEDHWMSKFTDNPGALDSGSVPDNVLVGYWSLEGHQGVDWNQYIQELLIGERAITTTDYHHRWTDAEVTTYPTIEANLYSWACSDDPSDVDAQVYDVLIELEQTWVFFGLNNSSDKKDIAV